MASRNLLRRPLVDMMAAVQWMSGSASFAPGGVARAGWLKLQPTISDAATALAREKRQAAKHRRSKARTA
jgi:hypothetical protein